MMRAVCPTVSVPRLHGNAVVQAPLFETNVRPAGVGSVTTTFAALAGPLLSTSIVKFTKPPGFALDGPVLAMLTSAFVGVTGVLLIVVVALAMLLLAFVSVDAESLASEKPYIQAVLSGLSGREAIKGMLARLQPKEEVLLLGWGVPMPLPVKSRRYDDQFWRELLGNKGKKGEGEILKELGF